jgi:predicted nucleotidyltransferase
MEDRFDQMMGRFLVPLSELGGRAIDSMYFLGKDGRFVFAQGYYHPKGSISGKIIYYPSKGGWVDIFGREYECMHKSYRNGKMYSYTNPEQIRKHYEVFPELGLNVPVAPIIRNNLLFPLDDFAGFFDPKKSLRICMELYPKIRNGIAAASDILEAPVDSMGLTGSLQYGRLEEHDDDTDIVFYGAVEDNYALMQRIRRIVKEDPKRHVHEFGKFWPLRFYHGGILVCPFFLYAREEEIPLHNCAIRVVKKHVTLTGRIADIKHSIYMPLIFPLEDVTLDGESHERFTMILGDSYVRGEFEAGQRIQATGELVNVEKDKANYPALLVANNWNVETIK